MQLLENPKVKKIAQNAPFEWVKSWMYGIFPNPMGFDTLTGNHCLYPDFGGSTDEWTGKRRDPSNPGHGLAFLTSFYTDIPYYKDDGRHWTPSLGEQKFWQYNCLDVMSTFEIAFKEMDELQQAGLWDYYQEIYLGTFEDGVRMEWQGILIDIERRELERSISMNKMAEWRSELRSLTGLDVISKAEKKGQKPQPGILNLSSPKQVLKWLTSKGYRVRLDRKTGNPTVDKDTFQMLIQKHPKDLELALMAKLRAEQDFISDNLDTEIDVDNRMHSHVKQGGTNGTRWSTAESILGGGRNFQNLPRQGPARTLFLPA